jgi:hypothetical protein
MRIKKFNESTGETIEVHCVITNDSAGYIIEDECKCFYENMKERLQRLSIRKYYIARNEAIERFINKIS